MMFCTNFFITFLDELYSVSDIDAKFITSIPSSFTDNERRYLPSSLHVLPLQIDSMNWFWIIFLTVCKKMFDIRNLPYSLIELLSVPRC